MKQLTKYGVRAFYSAGIFLTANTVLAGVLWPEMGRAVENNGGSSLSSGQSSSLFCQQESANVQAQTLRERL